MAYADRNDDANESNDAAPSPSAFFTTYDEFVRAICSGNERALREYFVLYAPLLRDQAFKIGVDQDRREELVLTVLDDVAMRLQSIAQPPRELAIYLIAALRNRARSWHRARKSYDDVELPSVVRESHSEYAVRASNDGGEEEQCGASTAGNLAKFVVEKLSAEELHLAAGMARNIPVRELAAQIGISYGAARVRVHRCRQRLLSLASAYVQSLDDDERIKALRFFARAGIQFESRPDQS